jgi:hypothetical protein
VSLKALSKQRPADPAVGATGIAALISGSDDYRLNKDVFVKATQSLLDQKSAARMTSKNRAAGTNPQTTGTVPYISYTAAGFTRATEFILMYQAGRSSSNSSD